ncbi:MAG: hypothetical protein ACKVGY_05690, partial [Candidatus Poseidoniales archaeon]
NYSSPMLHSIIIEYITVRGRNVKNFNEKINDMIQNGWILQGGVSVGGNISFETYAQALIKK